MPETPLRTRRHDRRGAALVEFSLVLPLLLMLMVGSIEIGRAITVRQTLAEASRAGARVYSMQTKKTKQDALDMVSLIMEDAGLETYEVTITPDSSSGIEHLDPVEVEISLKASDASWYPSPWFLGGENVIAARCVMPADLGKTGETEPESLAGPLTGPLVDRDPVKELSGLDQINLKLLEKDAAKLIEKALKAREKADKQLEKADKKLAEANEKLAEANEALADGDTDKYEKKLEDYKKKLEDYDKELAKWKELDVEAYDAEQIARAALAAATPTP